jgi:hypothetical protein
MGVQRTVLCPACRTPRVTKASGRQRLSCLSCGRPWLVRDSIETELAPAGAPSAEASEAPVADPPAPAAPETATNVPGVLGGATVLPPAALEIGGIAFPEPAPPAPPAAIPAPSPLSPGPVGGPAELGEPEPSPPPPMSPSPGRRLGYYGRVTGGRS